MHQLLKKAVEKRSGLLTSETDAVRLIDGAGDGLPGLVLEAFAGRWLVSTTTGQIAPQVREWLRDQGVSCHWKRLDQHQKESPTHLSGPETTGPFLMRENGVASEISFQSGYSQGIFLDQRDNRAEVRRLMVPGMKLLNTFAYTGAFSVAAAMAGAETTTLDLSQPYLDWAKRNLTHNSLDPAGHHFCKGDTFHWLRRFAKQGRTFDGIVLDPPTFSRDEKGKVFRVEENFGELAALAADILTPDGWLLCSTNCKNLGLNDFQKQLRSSIRRPMSARHSDMPPDFTDEPYLKSVWLRS
ncbi:class I SAM-dependent rRNA methyltransferase [Luteolibacter yonseiensis]|uniref:Class I SAM-dependent rRNA methyltransferase n=1 Tax=Luteolibacter yonseiensis TaxID=1144680 RepID=A0A934R1W4_9BACT|nr:class I SAM-dependent methyltransferase [Luteolibacter yonseiensis]MBK1815262.1 class I SAM-dependent rRNA methyltransferase [Luteolibacter yonseiensis]